MKLSEIREAYEELSGKLSNIVRQLAFAGIGVIWIFRINNSDASISISKELSIPLIFLIATLLLDALQYLVSTIIWYIVYCSNRRKDKNENRDIIEKEAWNIPSWIFFFAKTITLMISYFLLFIYLWEIIF